MLSVSELVFKKVLQEETLRHIQCSSLVGITLSQHNTYFRHFIRIEKYITDYEISMSLQNLKFIVKSHEFRRQCFRICRNLDKH